MILDEESYLEHYGIIRRSGRYPWGSGKTPHAHSMMLIDHIENLRRQGLSDTEIARGLGLSTTEFRAMRTMAKNILKQQDIAMAQRLKEKGLSNVAIGERMGINESSVRSLLAPGAKDKADVLLATSNMLKEQVDKRGLVDVGSGVELHLEISKEKLATAVAILKEEGYTVHNIQVDQLGTNNKTSVKVLGPPGTTYRDVVTNKDKIQQVKSFSKDGGRSYLGLHDPLNVDSKRIDIRYAEDGGAEADGVIYVRPGVDSVSLGSASYAQVRVAVDGTHYLKGMAMYKDDLPSGVDLQFNTNKSNTGNKHDAMKPMTGDPDNPFGSAISKQIVTRDANGKERTTSAMNIVNEEGDWDDWSRSLSTQMLSKQSISLAKTQLNMTYEQKRAELDEIKALSNPAVRKKLLESYADGADSSAVVLKAAGMPRQRTQVILPINSMRENEIYAPNFNNGDRVALIRYPHGGIFEIPELTVNNRHAPAKKALGRAQDAVGINSKVAARLSGADFDGDTVLVIPNNSGKIKTAPALEGLKNFDPQRAYPGYDGMKKMTSRGTQQEMGQITNLIADMTIRGANPQELARAVRHSMVVIDAEKHGLNYKQSAVDNGIRQLKAKYQGKANAGASTLITRATSEIRVPERKLRKASEGGPIDKATGKKVYVETGATYTDKKGKVVTKKIKSKKLAETDDAHTLSSGTPIEKVYADHSNKLKSMANEARREAVNTKPTPYSPSARAVYAKEVGSLNAKLNTALKNAPLERQAQVIANTIVSTKRAANPGMTDDEVKKIKSQALAEARTRTGAKKHQINITPKEWEAIQSGAISNDKLNKILNNTDVDKVKEYATPRTNRGMTPAKIARAKSMMASGYTQAEIAAALGVSVSTIKDNLS